jgi:transcriptional regulator with XRE-family HTH domain
MIEVLPAQTRRQDLAAFLRARRNTTTPEGVGLEVEERRHVPGLRREEVAELAGISTTWYTWLEQGREINVSSDVLKAIGAALRMNEHEVEYMLRLTSAQTPITHTLDPHVPPVLRTLVEAHREAPAYITTPRFDLLVWNQFMGDLMDYDAKSERLSRNILYRLFFDSSRRRLYADWEDTARRTVAGFRYHYALYTGDKHFEDLLRRMLTNADFERMWNLYEVALPGLPSMHLRHDSMGVLEITTVQATLDIAAGCYLAVFDCKKLS